MSEQLDCVFLEGVTLFGYIGVLDDEKRKGQNFQVDIKMGIDLRQAGRSDMLAHTVNYAEVFALAEQLMDEARFDLIESYAEQLCDEIFSYFDPVKTVSVTIRKPDAPIEGDFSAVGVTVNRSKND